MPIDPQAKEIKFCFEQAFDNCLWTHECQGVSHDDTSWYFSSNQLVQSIFRLDGQFRKTEMVDVRKLKHGHLGDIDVKDGLIYGALEKPLGILVMPTAVFDAPNDPDNQPEAYALVESDGSAPPQKNAPWCAYDPQRAVLYSSSDDGVDVLFAYEIDRTKRRFVHKPSLDCRLKTSALNHVQGGAITPKGRLILSSDAPGIYVFDLSSEALWGSADVRRRKGFWGLVGEEVEGVDVRPGVSQGSQETQIHLVLLDNDWPSPDDVIFKHYSVSDPGDL